MLNYLLRPKPERPLPKLRCDDEPKPDDLREDDPLPKPPLLTGDEVLRVPKALCDDEWLKLRFADVGALVWYVVLTRVRL